MPTTRSARRSSCSTTTRPRSTATRRSTRCRPKWGSKQPIYYVLGAIATLSRLEPYETLAPAGAIVFALASLGMFLLARSLLGADQRGAVLAMAIAGLNAMVLHTVLHPYFNQLWGYFAFLFSLPLAWWAVRDRDRAAAALLALFMLVGALAYPLALPIPGLALVVFLAVDVRERRRRGEATDLPSAVALWRGGRGLIWMLPVAATLAIPVAAGLDKAWDATRLLLDPNESLEGWAGDLLYFIPAHEFFGLATGTLWWLAVAAMAGLAVWLLTRLPRPVGWGIAAVLVAFLGAAVIFRHRDHGQYFEFKTLAFAAPLLVACAVVALSRLGRLGAILLLALVISAELAARPEVRETGLQLSRAQLELRDWADDLPADASVRFDLWRGNHLWGSYMLARQPLCSQAPLLGTDYPHVETSRKADYILLDSAAGPCTTTAHRRTRSARRCARTRTSGSTAWIRTSQAPRAARAGSCTTRTPARRSISIRRPPPRPRAASPRSARARTPRAARARGRRARRAARRRASASASSSATIAGSGVLVGPQRGVAPPPRASRRPAARPPGRRSGTPRPAGCRSPRARTGRAPTDASRYASREPVLLERAGQIDVAGAQPLGQLGQPSW